MSIGLGIAAMIISVLITVVTTLLGDNITKKQNSDNNKKYEKIMNGFDELQNVINRNSEFIESKNIEKDD